MRPPYLSVLPGTEMGLELGAVLESEMENGPRHLVMGMSWSEKWDGT